MSRSDHLLLVLKELIGELVDEKLATIAPRQVEVTPADEPRVPKRINASISEAAEILGVHRQTIYRMNREGTLKLVKLRRRTFVPAAELERLRNTLEQDPAPEPSKAQRAKKVKLYPRQ